MDDLPTDPEHEDTVGRLLPSEPRSFDLEERRSLGRVESALFGREAEAIELDRYQIERRIGGGGVGVVYAARDPQLGRSVAIKLLQAGIMGGTSESEGQARLLREAQAIARIQHPNVVAVHDVGTYDDLPQGLSAEAESDAVRAPSQRGVFIVMELVEGVDAGRWLGERPRTWQEVLDVFVPSGLGLAAAHAAGLIHRDFKPANVLVGQDGRARVLDFGVARSAGDAEVPVADTDVATPQTGAGLTRTGVVMGTPRYMAPEHHRGETVDERSDQFSFCVALWSALYGQAPFVGASSRELADGKTRGDIRPPPADREVPVWLERIVRRGLSAEPGQRYPSMVVLIDVLNRHRTRRRRIAVRGFIVAGLVAAAVGGIAIGRSGGQETVPNHSDATAAAKVVPRQPGVVAVLPFENRSGVERLDLPRTLLPHILSRDLTRVEGIEIVDYFHLTRLVEATSQAAPSPAVWRERAIELGASSIVRGELELEAERVVLRVIVEAADGAQLAVIERGTSIESVAEAVRELAPEIATAAMGRRAEVAASKALPLDFEQELHLGVASLERGAFDIAETHLRAAIAVEGDIGEAHFYLALALSWQEAPLEQSLDEIDRALAGDLTPAQRDYLVGHRVFLEQLNGDAIEHFRRVITLHPDDRYVRYGLFEALYHGGQPNEAVASYRHLGEVSPYIRLGIMHVLDYYAAQDDREGVAWALPQAEQVDDQFAAAWRVRHAVLHADYVDALAILDRIVVKPGFEGIFDEERVQVLALAGEMGSAKAIALQAAEDGIAGALVWLQSLATLAGDDPARLRYRRRAIRSTETDPTSFQAVKLRTEVALLDLVPGSAEHLQQDLDALDDGDLGRGREQRHEVTLILIQGALNDREALELGKASEFPEVRSVATAFLAEAQGNFEVAAESWGQAIAYSLDGQFVTLERHHRARTLLAAGDHEGTLAACAQVITPPRFHWSWAATLGSCLVWTGEAGRALGRSEQARTAYERLLAVRSRARTGDRLVRAARAGLDALR